MQEKAKILVYCVYVRSKYIYIGQKIWEVLLYTTLQRQYTAIFYKEYNFAVQLKLF